MLKRHNPPTVAPPFSRYSHGVEAPAKARWLIISGQVGVTPEGEVLTGAQAQIEQAWRNFPNAAGRGDSRTICQGHDLPRRSRPSADPARSATPCRRAPRRRAL
jgi:hypothetical protein